MQTNLGIWDLSYFNFGTSNAIKLQISGIIVTRFSVNLTLQSQPAGIWRKVKLGYLASSKPEVIMGSAHFGTFKVYLGTNSLRGTTVIQSVEKLFIPNFNKSIVRTFLNGFNLKKTSGTY